MYNVRLEQKRGGKSRIVKTAEEGISVLGTEVGMGIAISALVCSEFRRAERAGLMK